MSFLLGKDQQVSSEKAMEFDPIRQHKHFCPWIAPMGKAAPGWQQTQSALLRHQGSSPSSSKVSPSASIIEVFLDFSFHCTCEMLVCCTQRHYAFTFIGDGQCLNICHVPDLFKTCGCNLSQVQVCLVYTDGCYTHREDICEDACCRVMLPVRVYFNRLS